jgi:hypothetical protein
LFKVLLEPLDHKDHKDHKDPQELLGPKDRKGPLD